jgi:hypothetical protein
MQSFSSLVPLHLLQEGAAVAVEANLCHSWPKGWHFFAFKLKPKAEVAQNIE